MKRFFLLMCLIILCSCKNNFYSQRKSNLYQDIVKTYIEYRNSGKSLNKEENILLIGANTSKYYENSYWVDVTFVSPMLLQDVKYTKVYQIDGYKLIIDESFKKSNILKSSFKETKYENFNLAKDLIDYNVKNWHIIFNSKNEIIRITSPYRKSKEIKELLMRKGVKFSKDYEE
ncbi:hypothetical protein J2799_002996 [Chryseobacterium vietnamense]|uniref:hypothetical protein n=1 Tax=Chryseobacterium vietnamense TaxID=866785 RepID=UPI002864DD06|nr:hypothetical protein [Chryseobacterium vietnamense]MDR6488478.1 hypothetical protein [Chryseobacterium vietnamense]